ncbi:MAG TPA: SMP-30/gluconolactonase/LRE family protein [Tepidisphaeraceae bacterium]
MAESNNLNPPMMAKNASGTLGKIERLDPALDALLAPDATIEILAEGIQWAEGPVWYQGGLNFSDVPQNVVYRWAEGKGISVFLKPSGYTQPTPRGGEPGSNGLTVDSQGNLVLCQHGNRQVARLEKDGKSFTPLADSFEGKKLNSPNDLCFDSKGRLYFTDPSYGLEHRDQDPKREMDGNYVYLRQTDGKLVRICSSPITYADGTSSPVKFPNGVALSPDEKWLYVCASDPTHPAVLKYEIKADGTTGAGTLFFDAIQRTQPKRPGGPDGMKVDAKGNVWTSGPGGFWIFTREGKHLGTIVTNTQSANCAWGDDGATFYMCCNHQLCRIKTKTRGILPGARG